MYIFILSLVCFNLSRFKRNNFIILLFDILFPFFLAYLFLNIYFVGNDWISYYSDYIHRPISSHPLDFIFLIIIKFFYYISWQNFYITIYLYFLFIILCIKAIFQSSQLNLGGIKSYYIFLGLLLLILGPSLVLEQLRQFLATVFLIPFFILYIQGNKKYLFFMLLALLSHNAAIFFVFVAFLVKHSKSKLQLFNYLLMIGGLSILGIAFLEATINYHIVGISSLSHKLAFYQQNAAGKFAGVGIIHILCFLLLICYFCLYTERYNSTIESLVKLFIFSIFIYLISIFFPFLSRLLSTGIVLFIIALANIYINKKSYKIHIFYVYSILFIILIGVSYYRNPYAPFNFLSNDNDEIITNQTSLLEEIKLRGLEQMQLTEEVNRK